MFDLHRATGNVPDGRGPGASVGPSTPVMLQDRDFLQVRDGSGPNQRALSTT
ncbi:hypothetical protein [Pyxidicoccus sp. MSG2]|uniref:hypothetical protein n=1 Tax=Pyxidicoccus sp. MSG2 TaxID=2996790 RepID=UPI00226F021E|nr:hypothetical protein [Pyxidicoccus sp. MSG2]MCY1021355.1 hypothetical protein [Pyxidicoccus sp. MSG2]